MNARLALRALTAVLALGIIAGCGAGGSADAATRACVTRAEFGQVHGGDSRAHVERVFGTHGVSYGSGRQYRQCKRYAGAPHTRYAAIGYAAGRVNMKEWGTTR